MSELVFVYGTLRAGQENAAEMAGARFVARGTTRGRLYACRWPAFVEGDGSVAGELYEVDDVHLARLDAFEDEGTLYTREAREVRDEHGAAHRAWVYRWLGSVAGARIIPSGDVTLGEGYKRE
ncbi:MAG TPA: gamma-glutamylcyclotransferase family protein [Candidatus Dormibacteraeota bacterium]|nr:gamma-glutamylcyclotransferase family protein [Candidatus Dormibacteraeota bacterium]